MRRTNRPTANKWFGANYALAEDTAAATHRHRVLNNAEAAGPNHRQYRPVMRRRTEKRLELRGTDTGALDGNGMRWRRARKEVTWGGTLEDIPDHSTEI